MMKITDTLWVAKVYFYWTILGLKAYQPVNERRTSIMFGSLPGASMERMTILGYLAMYAKEVRRTPSGEFLLYR